MSTEGKQALKAALVEQSKRAPQGPRDTGLPDPQTRRALREAIKMHQTTAAMVLKVSRQSFVSWETGQHNPIGENLTKYKEFLSDIEELSKEVQEDG
jgi:DNA-binding XRE family transcriptional regulator